MLSAVKQAAKNEKKLNLEELVVQSFVTSLDEEMQRKLKGGRDDASENGCGGGGGGGGCYHDDPPTLTLTR